MDWNDEDDFDEEEYADLYADEDEAAELDLQQDIESEPESVDLSRFESSGEERFLQEEPDLDKTSCF